MVQSDKKRSLQKAKFTKSIIQKTLAAAAQAWCSTSDADWGSTHNSNNLIQYRYMALYANSQYKKAAYEVYKSKK